MRFPSPALTVSLVALAVALGGTGYAVTQLPKNSVGTKQLKNNAVTGAKVKAKSLEASDFKPGQLPAGPAGPPGTTGATGPAGATGAQGPAGPTASADIQFSTSTTLSSSGDIVASLLPSTDPLVLPQRMWVMVNAAIDLKAPAGGGAGRVMCQIQHRADGEPYWSPAGMQFATTLEASATTDVERTLGLTGAVVLDAATYDIGVWCRTDPTYAATVTAYSRTIAVIGAKASY